MATPVRKQPAWLYPLSSAIVYAALGFLLAWHYVPHVANGHEPADDQRKQESEVVVVGQPCSAAGHSVTVTFADLGWQPDPITVRRCDLVTLKNDSSRGITPALGPHDNHIQYPTFGENNLRRGQTMEFQALATGTYRLHDHVEDDATTEARLVVTE